MASTADLHAFGVLLAAACLAGCSGEAPPSSALPPVHEPDDSDTPTDSGEPTEPTEPTEPEPEPEPPCMANICWTPPASEGAHIHAGRTLGSGRDLQGDGFDELVVAAPGFFQAQAGIVWMVHGGATIGDEVAPASRWAGGTHFGERLSLAGDITGDGIGDLLVVNSDAATSTMRAYVLQGPLDVDGLADDAVSSAYADKETVADLLPWPDTNGDGLDEVLVLWWGRIDYETPTRLAVFETPLPPVLRAGQEDFGLALPWLTVNKISRPRDMDGDGLPEVLSVGLGYSAAAVSLHALEPGVRQTEHVYTPHWTGTEIVDSYWATDIAGDLDGDGTLDGWASGLPNATGRAGAVWLLFGPPSEAESLDHVPRIDGGPSEFLGFRVQAGDLDGDGQDDLVVSAPGDPYFAQLPGRVYAFLGPIPRARLDPADADYLWEGEHPMDSFGTGLTIGDFDGDGLGDIAIGAPRNDEVNDNAGKVYLFLGKDL